MLGLGVERRRRLVEHRDQRLVAHEAAGQRQLLPLTVGDVDALVPGRPELRPQAGGRASTTSRAPARSSAATSGRIAVTPGQVTEADRLPGLELEPEEVLERPGQAFPPLLRIDVRQVRAVDQDAAGARVVELGQQLDQRGLAGPVLPDDGDDGAGGQEQVDVVERPAASCPGSRT